LVEHVVRCAQFAYASLAFATLGFNDRIFPVRDESIQIAFDILFVDMLRNGHGFIPFLSEKEWGPLP
jgi:hypothetical protein